MLFKPYTTVADVQRETRNNDANFVSWFEEVINDASRYVDVFTGADFWFHDYTTNPFFVHPNLVFGNRIFLPWPVIELDQVSDEGVILSPSTYEYKSRSITAKKNFSNRSWEKTVSVKGKFGYNLASSYATQNPPVDLPADIRRATTMIASAWKNRKEVINAEGNRDSLLTSEIPKDAWKLLQRRKERVL